MKKIINILFIFVFFLLVLLVVTLATIGIETSRFNTLISKKINQTNNNIICLDNTFIDTHVLAKINIGTSSFGIQIDDTPDTPDTHSKTRIYAGPTNLKKINIKLLDVFGKPINLNKMDWSFTLELEKLYQNIV